MCFVQLLDLVELLLDLILVAVHLIKGLLGGILDKLSLHDLPDCFSILLKEVLTDNYLVGRSLTVDALALLY